jgi:hypothetical protein
MSGTGGNDFICGHCGHVMLEDFDPSTIKGNPVYQCGVCENNNNFPFAASGRRWSSGVIHVGDPFSRGKKNRKAKV